MRVFFFLVAIVVALTACEKYPDNMIVTINESGYLTVNIKDQEGKAIDNATIRIIDRSEGLLFLNDSVDKSGIYRSEAILQGNYLCSVTAKKNKAIYTDEKNVQIIAGINKEIEINPYANSGNLSFQLIGYYSNEPLVDKNVALMYDEVAGGEADDYYLSNALLVGKTNSAGEVFFEDRPAGWHYSIVILEGNNVVYGDIYSSYFRVVRDTDNAYKVRVY